ncbi:hypothetical protein OSB04_002247 [Centaurea solstitialis]|uniref:Cathepsin propeptide inhibitor domain-containing protein n=1 Tax=Centaurea solstitialis TaxID=347529 RepID=A0AA38U551_9ASTR|nr:hypothetical protein OSB04_002247 [Centaurea solstitialis]
MGLSLGRSLIVIALLVFGMWACDVTSRALTEETMLQKHQQWMARYGREYKDDLEKETRFKIFKDNGEYIESFKGAGNRGYKLSVNEFADQTNDEFKAVRNGFKVPSGLGSGRTTSFMYEYVNEVPSSMDWRKKGVVTPIKEQGQCEGITQLTTGKLISLSEQELMDCDRSGEDQGYEGGLQTQLTTPKRKRSMPPRSLVTRTCPRANDELALLKAVAMQPVSVAIDAGESDF